MRGSFSSFSDDQSLQQAIEAKQAALSSLCAQAAPIVSKMAELIALAKQAKACQNAVSSLSSIVATVVDSLNEISSLLQSAGTIDGKTFGGGTAANAGSISGSISGAVAGIAGKVAQYINEKQREYEAVKIQYDSLKTQYMTLLASPPPCGGPSFPPAPEWSI